MALREIIFIVNGEDCAVGVPDWSRLSHAVDVVLHETRNHLRPRDHLELRHEPGDLVDDALPARTIAPRARLFLTLKVGIGGAAAARSAA